jgi:hypothetical protein
MRLRERYSRGCSTGKATEGAAAVRSISRLELALVEGLSLHLWWTNVLGRYGDMDVILRARQLGMPWKHEICEGAAREGRLSLLKALYFRHQVPLGPMIAWHAARAPTPDTLIWLREIRAGRWCRRDVKRMLIQAEKFQRAENSAWLRSIGAVSMPGTTPGGESVWLGRHVCF